LEVLIGNTFLTAASISYYGPFSGKFRDELVESWKSECKKYEILYTENYSI